MCWWQNRFQLVCCKKAVRTSISEANAARKLHDEANEVPYNRSLLLDRKAFVHLCLPYLPLNYLSDKEHNTKSWNYECATHVLGHIGLGKWLRVVHCHTKNLRAEKLVYANLRCKNSLLHYCTKFLDLGVIVSSQLKAKISSYVVLVLYSMGHQVSFEIKAVQAEKLSSNSLSCATWQEKVWQIKSPLRVKRQRKSRNSGAHICNVNTQLRFIFAVTAFKYQCVRSYGPHGGDAT